MLKHLPPTRQAWLFDRLLVEIDRKDRLYPYHHTVDELLAAAKIHLPEGAVATVRLQALAQRDSSSADLASAVAAPAADADLSLVPRWDGDAIDRALDTVSLERPKILAVAALALLARQATTPQSRIAFVTALVEARRPSLGAKLRVLEQHLPVWTAHSPALRDSLPRHGCALAATHAGSLVTKAWATSISWRDLCELFGLDRVTVARAAVGGLGAELDQISGDAWLGLAAAVEPAAVKVGLERFLTKSGATLPEDVGDGPWRSPLQVPEDRAHVAGMLVWSRLGHYTAEARWRAAHAVRQLAELDRWDVLDAIIDLYDARPTPFCDANLPFFLMHAQLWLLIALARLAQDRPAALQRYRPLFERVAFTTAFPHVVLRAVAAKALTAMLPILPAAEAAALSTRLDGVNRSPFARVERGGFAQRLYQARPESDRDNDPFHLGYEFKKSTVVQVCDLFGVPGWVVEDQVDAWVKRWAPEVKAMWDCPRLGQEYAVGRDSDSVPELDRYGAYLGWHALTSAVGMLLTTHPISGDAWRADPWPDFLRQVDLSRPDGLWWADLTDLAPTEFRTPLPRPDPDETVEDRPARARLLALVGLGEDGQLGKRMMVSGQMLDHHVDVSVASVLASPKAAGALIAAVQGEAPFHRWLPTTRDAVERHCSGRPVFAWIDSDPHREQHPDRHDPYAAPKAQYRPAPEDWVRAKYRLMPADPVVRAWRQGDAEAFHAQAWGAESGRGDHRTNVSGQSLWATTPFLLNVLQQEGMELVMSIKLTRYLPQGEAGGDSSGFAHRHILLRCDRHGRVRLARRLPNAAKAAFAALSRYDRDDFRARFETMMETGHATR